MVSFNFKLNPQATPYIPLWHRIDSEFCLKEEEDTDKDKDGASLISSNNVACTTASSGKKRDPDSPLLNTQYRRSIDFLTCMYPDTSVQFLHAMFCSNGHDVVNTYNQMTEFEDPLAQLRIDDSHIVAPLEEGTCPECGGSGAAQLNSMDNKMIEK